MKHSFNIQTHTNDKTKEKEIAFPMYVPKMYEREPHIKECLTCIFWSGHRRFENRKFIAVSKKTIGNCLWNNQYKTASESCNQWKGK